MYSQDFFGGLVAFSQRTSEWTGADAQIEAKSSTKPITLAQTIYMC